MADALRAVVVVGSVVVVQAFRVASIAGPLPDGAAWLAGNGL